MTSAKTLSRLVAASGDLSRRVAEEAVRAGRVTLNGSQCKRIAARVRESSVIKLDGRRLGAPPPPEAARLWRYYKPRGLLTTHDDPEGRSTVFASLPAWLPRVISVGRLDAQSEGLLLLTNSPPLSRLLAHPSSGLDRVYYALLHPRWLPSPASGLNALEQTVTPRMIEQLRTGITLNDGTTFRPMQATLVPSPPVKASSPNGEACVGEQWVRMKLTEGKNREVRRAWGHFGFGIRTLVRTRFGPWELGELPPDGLSEVPAATVLAVHATAARRMAMCSQA